jgi:hypothetical protein
VFSAEQSAFIGGIESEKNNRHEMAAESRTRKKNPKTQTIRKMLDQEGPRITLLWVPSHKGILGNEKANQAANEALNKDIPPLKDTRQTTWINGYPKRTSKKETKNGNNEMKERKPDVDRKEDTKGMPRKKQVAISRLRTVYTRATYGPKMERVGNPLCPFYNTDLSVDHILCECKETEDQGTNIEMNKEQWINGKKGMEKMIDHAKEIGLYNEI